MNTFAGKLKKRRGGSIMEVKEAIKIRRSIRKYKPDDLDESTVQEILDAGRYAPSWANSQCVRFVVIRNPNTKARIADEVLTKGTGRYHRFADDRRPMTDDRRHVVASNHPT